MEENLIRSLQKKYNYDLKTIIIIKKIIRVLIEYYEIETYEELDEMFQKILNTEIHVRKNNENPNEYISKSLGIRENYITSDEIDGYATTRPVIKNGEITSKSIIYLFNELDINNPLSWDVLVHELCHIVKMTEFYIDGNVICKTTGFQNEKYGFDGKLIDRTRTALEETATSHDEIQIMNRLLQRDNYNLFEQGSGYALAELYLQQLIKFMSSIDENFEPELKKGRISYVDSIFTPFGVCFINNFFEECNNAMYIEDDNELTAKEIELQTLFKLVIKSMNDIVQNYTRISKEEKQKRGL